MGTKKVLFLIAMIFLNGGLILGKVEVSKACDSTNFEGVDYCDMVCPPGDPYCDNTSLIPKYHTVVKSADWWCSTDGCINDCYDQWDLSCDDKGTDSDVDYRFCGSDGNIYEISCSQQGCIGDDGGWCDATVVKTDCSKCDASGYNYTQTCTQGVEGCVSDRGGRTGVSPSTKCALIGPKYCDDNDDGCCKAMGRVCQDFDGDGIKESCVAVSTAMNLEISMSSSDNPMETDDSKNVKFDVTKSSDGSDISGANVTITSVNCVNGSGSIPNPGLTNASGRATSDFSAPSVASTCTINAKATKDGFDDATATYIISVLSGSCISATGGFKISFDDDNYTEGDTVRVNAFTEASDSGGCVVLYHPMTNNKDQDSFGSDNIGSALKAGASAGTWYGGLFFGGCGAYAAADCQAEVNVVSATPPTPPCTPAWNCASWTACANDPNPPGTGIQSQTCTGINPPCSPDTTTFRPCCDNDSHCANPKPFCDIPANQCVECLTTPDCVWKGVDLVCDANKNCIPCKTDGEAANDPDLCCEGLNLIANSAGTLVCSSGCDPNAWFYCNPLRDTVETLVLGGEKITEYILGIIGSVCLLVIVVAGTMYMSSTGNEEKVASSKRILTAAVVGLGLALLAYSMLKVIIAVLNM